MTKYDIHLWLHADGTTHVSYNERTDDSFNPPGMFVIPHDFDAREDSDSDILFIPFYPELCPSTVPDDAAIITLDEEYRQYKEDQKNSDVE